MIENIPLLKKYGVIDEAVINFFEERLGAGCFT